ncbi:sensor histidine kinase [Dethiosulfovibrio salsuginis]|uniref:Two-component system, NarL family, sensor histidine kinase DegS n=1 Tax=Dethiosulfovibrio salsuginis TaxID=561720 RepID=A0A1X7L6A8_9BACT|nr:ATP-binding protein [Dethiosulfovibrio salsuginis]SMG48903.1 two-component system, NarL family, sensor histidine kinase DegS [Dethiosulfovibrio salsuginis]
MDRQDALKQVIERVQKDLIDSVKTVSDFRKDELTRLDSIRKELKQVREELATVIEELDSSTKAYFSARADLSQIVRSGGEAEQREAYERAEGFMLAKAGLSEREKGLRNMRDYLERDERRVAAQVERSDAVATKFRLALDVVNDEIEAGGSSKKDGLSLAYGLVERESRSLAREIHDGPAQRFAGAMMSLDFTRRLMDLEQYDRACQELSKVKEQMTETMDEIRSFLFLLYPRDMEDGLDVALVRLGDSMSQKYGVPIGVKSFGPIKSVPEFVGANVYKIVRQALGNALLKGNPERVTVMLSVRSDRLFVKVMDDGSGFDVEKAKESAIARGSYGLVSMEERARLAGGELKIESVLGQGTIVSLEVPLRGDLDRD